MLAAIREDVTMTLAKARLTMDPADLPPMPDFVTQHIDPFTGDDDTYDIDGQTGAILSNLPPLSVAPMEIPAGPGPSLSTGTVGAGPAGQAIDDVLAPASRNAPCPCGSGRKYKHCHGAVA